MADPRKWKKAMTSPPVQQKAESLDQEVQHIESETRMILPGLQALFGFQLIAVFNERFESALSFEYQAMHWFALGCTAVATVFAISPAAFHRLAEPHQISSRFTSLATKWVSFSLFPLALGCCTDFFLIGFIITKSNFVSAIVSAALFILFIFMWYLFPIYNRKHALPSK
jgi:hypothetical protein